MFSTAGAGRPCPASAAVHCVCVRARGGRVKKAEASLSTSLSPRVAADSAGIAPGSVACGVRTWKGRSSAEAGAAPSAEWPRFPAPRHPLGMDPPPRSSRSEGAGGGFHRLHPPPPPPLSHHHHQHHQHQHHQHHHHQHRHHHHHHHRVPAHPKTGPAVPSVGAWLGSQELGPECGPGGLRSGGFPRRVPDALSTASAVAHGGPPSHPGGAWSWPRPLSSPWRCLRHMGGHWLRLVTCRWSAFPDRGLPAAPPGRLGRAGGQF